MNKYQEALDYLKDLTCDEANDCTKCRLANYCGRFQWVKTLQELVDKATPMKVLNKHKEYFYYDEEQPFPASKITGICPICNHSVEQDKYCNRCGQKLDWSGNNG